jgi:hypothetical protein
MGDMRIGHEIVIIAQYRHQILFGRGPVDCGAFPDDIVIADDNPGIFLFISRILGWQTDGDKRIYMVAFSNSGVRVNDRMGFYDRIAPDTDVFSDNAIGADFDSIGQFGMGAYDRSRMNFHIHTLKGMITRS